MSSGPRCTSLLGITSESLTAHLTLIIDYSIIDYFIADNILLLTVNYSILYFSMIYFIPRSWLHRDAEY